MAFSLIVVSPIPGYAVGTKITDQSIIANILNSDMADNVVAVPQDPPLGSVGVVVGATLVSIGLFDVSFDDAVTLSVQNVGANALTQFAVRLRTTSDAPQVVAMSSAAQFAAPDAVFAGCIVSGGTSSDPTTLPANQSALLRFNTQGIGQLELFAASTAGTTVNCYKGGE